MSKDELRAKLAELYKANKDQVSIFGLRTQYGGGKSTGFALIYDSHEAMKKFEHSRREYGLETTESPTLAENCLTLVTSATASTRQTRFVTLEAMRLDYPFDTAEIGQEPRTQAMPVYHVVGLWFFSARDDPDIGADLAESWASCDAILV